MGINVLVYLVLQLLSSFTTIFLSQGVILSLISHYCIIRLLPYLAGSHTDSSTCLIQKGAPYSAVLIKLLLLVTHLGLQSPTLCGVREPFIVPESYQTWILTGYGPCMFLTLWHSYLIAHS